MAKKESILQKAEREIKELIQKVNVNIEWLGVSSGKLYQALTDIQQTFDLIRGVPSEERLKFEEIKRLSSSWKLQADRIEAEYNDFIAKNAMAGAAGGALGVSVAAFGPTVAMGMATTFGVASTGTAISALSGAAATNAALAWLGGGALAAGGGGMAAGNALLALAGPIGWGICLVSLSTCGFLYFRGRARKNRLEEIFTLVAKRTYKRYKLAETEIKEKINTIMNETSQIQIANQEIQAFGTNYHMMSEDQQYKLGVYVNLMFAATQNLVNPIKALLPKFTVHDWDKYAKSIPFSPKLKMKERNLVVSLANFFHSIELDQRDINILYKSLRKDENFLKSSNVKKEEFSEFDIQMAVAMDKFKYPRL